LARKLCQRQLAHRLERTGAQQRNYPAASQLIGALDQ